MRRVEARADSTLAAGNCARTAGRRAPSTRTWPRRSGGGDSFRRKQGRLAGVTAGMKTRVDDVRQHFHCATARFAHAAASPSVIASRWSKRRSAPQRQCAAAERDVVLIRALVPEVDAAQRSIERHQLLLAARAQCGPSQRATAPVTSSDARRRSCARDRTPTAPPSAPGSVVRHSTARDRSPARLREPRRRRSREAAWTTRSLRARSAASASSASPGACVRTITSWRAAR